MEMKPLPKVGDDIYIPTALYISSGSEDVQGGLARVTRIESKTFGSLTTHLVYVHENPGTGYSWEHNLGYEQDKLKAEFGDRRAFPDPDDRPSSNEPW